MWSRAGGVAAIVLVVLVLVAQPGRAADRNWREVLEHASDPDRAVPFAGRLLVVRFEGPSMVDVHVTRTAEGEVWIGVPDTWMVGRQHGEAYFGDAETGTLLRLGTVERAGFSIDRLGAKYDVRVEGEGEVAGWRTTVLTLHERGAQYVRERLFVDERSAIVLRRETYGANGEPMRLAVFTDVDFGATRAPGMGSWETEETLVPGIVSDRGVEILRDVGWVVSDELPGSFELVAGYALGETEGASLHLVYSDGLYTISVYQQHGVLDVDGLPAGAERTRVGQMRVYRWPHAEPGRMVWTGRGTTFVAVSDAPPDQLYAALSALPHDDPPSAFQRLRHGFRRVVGWLWPFG